MQSLGQQPEISLAELKESALIHPETKQLWAACEIRLMQEMLPPLLEQTHEALLEYREQLRGTRMGEISSRQSFYETGTAHINWAAQAVPLLHRLKEAMTALEMPFILDGYFLNPSGYIVSAAARHNQLNRVNDALTQTESLQKQLAKLSDSL